MSETYPARAYNLDAEIPEELTEADQWVCWTYAKPLTEGGKPGKVPVSPATLEKLSWGNPENWLSYDDAVSAYRANPKLNGIGIILTPELGLVGGDLDHAIDLASGEVQEWATEHVRDFGTYTEVSPSGGGFRLFVRGQLPADAPKKVGDREVYSDRRFLTITGNVWRDDPIVANEAALGRYVGAMREARAQRAGPVASAGAARGNAEIVSAILQGEELHDSTRDYAFRLIDDGVAPAKVVETLRGIMLNSAARSADAERWQDRYDDIPRLVRDAEGKLKAQAAQVTAGGLAETLRTLTTSLTPAEIEEARKLWPHVFTFGETGAFPLGEVTIVGAPGREGKTTILVGLLARFALELPVGGMMPSPGVAVVLSAEDDRAQYARKLGALLEGMTPAARAQVLERVKIPNLYDPSVRAYRRLVSVADRQPAETAMVPALIEALGPLTDAPVPLRLLIVETASTWNDAGEDNPGQRAIVDACKQVAHALGVAVVLVHHTSQAAANNLPTLDIGANDIRGGTALTFNSRQNWLLVSLGEVDNPFPGTDARTVLREAIAPGDPHRIGALICLDSSKSDDPPPIFWRWERSPGFGPRAIEVQAPAEFAGKRWRKVHAMIRARKAEQRSEAKQAAADASVRHCVELVARLGEAGKPATARAVSVAAGRSAGWAAPYLSEAIAEGLLGSREELVPRVKGPVSVYFVPDSSEGDE